MSWWGVALLVAVLVACFAERLRAEAAAKRAEEWNRKTLRRIGAYVNAAPGAASEPEMVDAARRVR